MTAVDYERLFKHYAWESLIRRAGPSVPADLLATIARATAHEVPAIRDSIGAVEWHIERIVTMARNALAVQTVAADGALPAIGYSEGMEAVAHTRPNGEVCFTPLPAPSSVCGCGVYVLVGVDALPDLG